MKKNYVAILLVIAFICTYLHGLTASPLLALGGVLLLCACALFTIFEKK